MPFAERTTIAVKRTKADIDDLLHSQGAYNHASGVQNGVFVLMFEADGRRYRFSVRLPHMDDDEIRYTKSMQLRSTAARVAARDQEHRRLFRALLLVLKAKFESVDSGIESTEQAFLANLVLPNGSTMAEWSQPQIDWSYESQTMPPMLPGASAEALAKAITADTGGDRTS